MRNWHHKVIKIDQARALNQFVNNRGNSDIYIGVIEGQIEFEKINNVPFPLTVNDYGSPHPSFADIQNGKKVFWRSKIDRTNTFDQNIRGQFKPSMHTTCVAGIISGNSDDINNIEGICPNIRIINGDNFDDALFLSLVNSYSNQNIRAPFFQTAYDSNFISNSIVNPIDIYVNRFASIISCSFNIKDIANTHPIRSFTSTHVDFIFKELFAYGRNGRGVLVIVSAGNNSVNINDNTNSLGFRSTVYSKKTLIVAASKVQLDAFNLNTYNNVPPVFKEGKSNYSNYGKRIDLCAPSGPDASASKDDINIYSPTITNGGDIGTVDQVFDVNIIESNNSDKLVLANVKGVFKGQSIELGLRNTFTHELRYIKNVEEIPNTTNVKITLDTSLKYTKNNTLTSNYNLINTTAKLLVLKKIATRYFDAYGVLSNNRLNLNNLKGIKASSTTPQKVYIYEINSPNNGIYTEIKTILNYNTGAIELTNSLNNFNQNDVLRLIPDQIKASIVCTATSPPGTIYRASNNHELDGFFDGQEVLLKSSNESRITFITGLQNFNVEFTHAPGQNGDIYTIESLAYGDFTSRFTGTSAATPIVSGLAGLVLSANQNLNAAEIKHILKSTTDQIGSVTYSPVSNQNDYNYGYEIDSYFGTGRVNAENAVKLALNWHCPDLGQQLIYPEIPVEKPNLQIADKLNGTAIATLLDNEPVDSPDIWVKPLVNPGPNPLNTLNTSDAQKIYIKVRNTGSRQSFKECDLRVFIAFTDEATPAFPFPTSWYDQPTVKLLAVKEIPVIPARSEATVEIEWKNIATFWDINNPLPRDPSGNLLPNGLRKRAYILAHIAPFDGLPNDVRTDNIRQNKQLTCKEIIVTHNGVNDRTAYIPTNNLNITVGSEIVIKSFDLTMENVLASDLNGLKIQATKKNINNQTTETVIYKKSGSSWALESGAPEWIEFQTPSEIASNYYNRSNMIFPHTLKVNEQIEEVKLEIIA